MFDQTFWYFVMFEYIRMVRVVNYLEITIDHNHI